MAPSMRSSTASPGPSEPYSPTANAFPRQVGAELRSPRSGNGFLSPNPSSLSSDPEDLRSTPMSDRGEEKQILRKPGRGAPGDSSLIGVVRNEEGKSLAKRKSQFYGEVFSYRESNVSARNKVHQYSVITAEVKTNIIVCLSVIGPPCHFAKFLHRLKMNTSFLLNSPNTFPSVIIAQPLQFSSP